MSGDLRVQLVTRLPEWSAGALLRCIVLPVSPCVVSFYKFHEPDTHDLLRTSCRRPRSIRVRHVRPTRPISSCRDVLATSICCEDATKKLLPWNFSFTVDEAYSTVLDVSAPLSPSMMYLLSVVRDRITYTTL